MHYRLRIPITLILNVLFILYKLNCSKQPCVRFNFSYYHFKIINFVHFCNLKSENTLSDITIISNDRNNTNDIIICHRIITINKGCVPIKLPWLKRFMNEAINELKLQQTTGTSDRNYLPYVDVVNILKLLYKIRLFHIIYEIRNFLKRLLNNKQCIIVHIKASFSTSYVSER